MPEDFFNFSDLGFGDRFVFVPRNSGTTITATDLLNVVTANFPSEQNFVDFPNTSFVFPTPFAINPPQIESVNNGDDVFMRFTSNDNSIVFEVFANADGSMTDITIRNQLLDPADFASLILPVDPNDILQGTDIDLETIFGDFGFVLQDPFLGADLTQGLDNLNFDGLSLAGGGFLGGLFDFGGGSDGGGGFGFDFGSFDFSFGGGYGGGGFSDFGGGGYFFADTDFSSLSLV